MNDYEERKKLFVEICRKYSSLKHIRSRGLFNLYANKVEKDIYLTRKMLEHFVKFLHRDNKNNDIDSIRKYFDFLLEPQVPVATLEPFYQ